MNALFESLGYIFGYLLWFAYDLVENFAVAILIFTVILRALQFPLQINSQKSMAGTMRLQKKQQELQEKYGKDREKLNEELTKLYEKENISPTAGCTTTMIPMFLLFGVYYAIRNPLTNTLHIAKDSVEAALSFAKGLPVVGNNAKTALLLKFHSELIESFLILSVSFIRIRFEAGSIRSELLAIGAVAFEHPYLI